MYQRIAKSGLGHSARTYEPVVIILGFLPHLYRRVVRNLVGQEHPRKSGLFHIIRFDRYFRGFPAIKNLGSISTVIRTESYFSKNCGLFLVHKSPQSPQKSTKSTKVHKFHKSPQIPQIPQFQIPCLVVRRTSK
jgi:hypothetical protein